MASSHTESLQAKQEFFTSLDALVNFNEDEGDKDRRSLIVTKRDKNPDALALERSPSRSYLERSHGHKLVRSNEAEVNAGAATEPKKALPTPSTSEAPMAKKQFNVRNALSNSMSISPCTLHNNNTSKHKTMRKEDYSSKPNKRAKIHSTKKVTTQKKQIFKGLSFFYFPNNDFNVIRRARINLAIDRGAVWLRELDPSVTHIIVDEKITSRDVLKCLDLEQFPVNVAVVLPCWQSESIENCRALEVKQRRYRVSDDSLAKLKSDDSTLRTIWSSATSTAENKEQLARQEPNQSSLEYHPEEHYQNEIKTHGSVAQASEPIKTMSSAFDQAVSEAKVVAHLPLESDDEDTDLSDTSRETNCPDRATKQVLDFSKNVKHAPVVRSTSQWKQQRFACRHASEPKETCVNGKTILILQQMCDYYESVHDTFRAIAYRKAITTLKRQTTLITSKEEAQKLNNIGSRLAKKIEEIFWTNRLTRLEATKSEPLDVAFRPFLQIYGVGYAQASAWVQQGFRTIQELQRNVRLTENQRVGIDHFQDFQSRIPRGEVAELGCYVQNAMLQIDPKFQIIIGGSYRRGSKDSSDIDLIITKPNGLITEIRTVVLDTLVPQLTEQGFLKVALAETSRCSGTKWQGACTLPHHGDKDTSDRPWRRVDFLLVPWNEIGAAMLYFTGNDIFNRSMRLLARKKNMRLNQRGLFKNVMRGPSNQKQTDGVKVEGASERRIFEILQVPWREPEERNC